MNKIKQREAMKKLMIVNVLFDRGIAESRFIGVNPHFTEVACSVIKGVSNTGLDAINNTPAKVFRADKPKVDGRRLRRFHRQVKNVKSLTLTLQPSDSEQIKADWANHRASNHCAVMVLGDDVTGEVTFDGVTIKRVTDIGDEHDFFTEQFMTHPDIKNSEESYLKDLHKKAGFELPSGNCSLQSLRASYNFKAKKAGIETYKWTNK